MQTIRRRLSVKQKGLHSFSLSLFRQDDAMRRSLDPTVIIFSVFIALRRTPRNRRAPLSFLHERYESFRRETELCRACRGVTSS